MRFRMVHQLAMLLMAVVSLSVLFVAGGVLLSLRDGFGDYLQHREAQRRERFAHYFDARAGSAGPAAAPADDAASAHELVRGLAQLELASAASGQDADFLQRQYRGIAIAALVSLGMSMGLAVWLARRWTRPLGVLQGVTRDLAAGRFDPTEPAPEGPREIAQLSDDLSSMADSLRKLELARRKWMAQISHELRTPLSVLQGEIESVEDGAREPSRALVVNLGEEVRHMVRIVDDLHLLAVADLGSLPCHPIELDPLDTLDYIVERLIRHPSLDGLRVEVSVPERRALKAFWDPVRIEQVLRNLLGNSARYTTRPGRLRLSWDVDDDGRHLWLGVEDSAPAVDASDLPHVFEPLFRVDRSRQRSGPDEGQVPGGSGLGLAIVRAILLAHGGNVSAGPSPLGGLAIRLALPVIAAQEGTAA